MDNTIRINSGIEGADEKDAFMITRAAIDAVKDAIRDNSVPDEYFVRVAVEAGGCCGMNFFIEFDNEFDKSRDRMIEEMGVKIVMDNLAIFQLLGVTLDYEKSIDDEGFIFRGFRDPDAVGGGCGCGDDDCGCEGHGHGHGGGCGDDDCGCDGEGHGHGKGKGKGKGNGGGCGCGEGGEGHHHHHSH